MKLIILLSLTCIVAASLVDDMKKFDRFKIKFGKKYKDHQEEDRRFSIFQKTLQEIEQHNKEFLAGYVTYIKGINQFADMTDEEFIAVLTPSKVGEPEMDKIKMSDIKLSHDTIPDSIDWRQSGAVSPVKDQGQCGSCWAFSATGVLESFYYLKNNETVLFSEQQLVDCDTTSGGCDGGLPENGLEYIHKNGIEKESTYPYDGHDDTCHHDPNKNVNLKIKEIRTLKPGDESLLREAVGSLGPISVALDARELRCYQTGVFTGKNCSQNHLNHAVLAAGYGHDDEAGLDYWLIKNSYGGHWGEEGYFRIKRGDNQCGIATHTVFPILE